LVSAVPLVLAVGAVHLRVALPVDEPPPEEPVPPDPDEPEPDEPEPDEPEPDEPEDPVLLVDPELPVEPVLLDPDVELCGLALEVEPEPEPPPHPERMSTAAEMPQSVFSAFSDGKRPPPNPTVLRPREATIRSDS
jgi:hypothetical protein